MELKGVWIINHKSGWPLMIRQNGFDLPSGTLTGLSGYSGKSGSVGVSGFSGFSGAVPTPLAIKEKWFCGYVGVGGTHPCCNLNDHEIYERFGDKISPHGGITYSDFNEKYDSDYKKIIKIISDDSWYWIGFDVNHFGDEDRFKDEDKEFDYTKTELLKLADGLYRIFQKTKRFDMKSPNGIRKYINYIFKETK